MGAAVSGLQHSATSSEACTHKTHVWCGVVWSKMKKETRVWCGVVCFVCCAATHQCCKVAVAGNTEAGSVRAAVGWVHVPDGRIGSCQLPHAVQGSMHKAGLGRLLLADHCTCTKEENPGCSHVSCAAFAWLLAARASVGQQEASGLVLRRGACSASPRHMAQPDYDSLHWFSPVWHVTRP